MKVSMNLYDLFHETARRQPEHPAILGPSQDTALTYSGLDEAIRAAASRLRKAGVQPGDCVGLHHPSGSPYIVLTYAAWQCGACVVPVATELAAEEKREICREISLDYILSSPGTAAFAEPFRRGEATGIGQNIDLMPIRSPCLRPAGYDRVQAAFIRFTSGTTGTSKGVVLSHATIHDRIQAANDALAIGPADRVLWLLSMAYHFTVSIVSYLSFGATIVLPSNHFAAAVAAAMARHRTTLLYASPAHCALLADYAEGPPLPGLRLAISTTTSLDRDVARRFLHRYGQPVAQALGIIEVGLPCINLDFAAEKNNSVGRVLPAYELQLKDIGLGRGLGEVLFRGKGFLDAYYQPWRSQDQIMPDGWFHTGDIGQLDADGCLFLRGRSKDVISVMGMKFFPQEVETVLASHPAVAEVVVFARRHPRLGETPCARVVPSPSADQDGLEADLRQWCAQRLASYKVPERVELVDSLPRTASGKLLHREAVGGERS
jgi:long-chain acyl-CoA synthetase